MKNQYIVVRKPVGIKCTQPKCGGLVVRVDLSRLEEGLGHEGFECRKCHRRVKYVPEH